MTAVLYWRVKVDNMICLFSPNGSKLLGKGLPFDQLHSVVWQPYPEGTFKKPSMQTLKKKLNEEEKVTNGDKPKRFFAFGGSNSSFA